VVVRFGGAGIPFMPWHETGMVGSLFSFSTGAPGQIIPTLTTMVVDGVFDRIPSLKVVCVEAGCGWAAYLMDRLDEKHRFFHDMAAVPLDLRPSEYLQRNVWFVAEPEERTIGAALDLVGEDRIVWGSDFPHIDSTLDAPNLIRQSVAALAEVRRIAVMGGNAAALFGWSP
jgi:predicted TIM-barrel fold metal-dependent hydrolase